MSIRQKIAIVAPLVLVLSMYFVFHLLAEKYGEDTGWYLGLIIYWLIWGIAFSLWAIGMEGIKTIVQPRRGNRTILLLVILPLILASLSKLIPEMGYEKENLWVLLMLLLTAFGNGFFEELLWRGVYMRLFPDSNFFRIIWPSICFAIWHYAPGSVHSDGNVIILMAGALVFGLYLGFVAKKTDTVWWTIVIHTLSGIIQIV